MRAPTACYIAYRVIFTYVYLLLCISDILPQDLQANSCDAKQTLVQKKNLWLPDFGGLNYLRLFLQELHSAPAEHPLNSMDAMVVFNSPTDRV